MTADIQRDLGRVEGNLDGLARSIDKLSSDIEALTERLNKISARFDQADGGLKVLISVASVSAVVGGLVAQFMPYLFNK